MPTVRKRAPQSSLVRLCMFLAAICEIETESLHDALRLQDKKGRVMDLSDLVFCVAFSILSYVVSQASLADPGGLVMY